MGENLESHIHHLDAVKILPFHCIGENGNWRLEYSLMMHMGVLFGLNAISN